MLEAETDRHSEDWDPFVRLGHWSLAAFFALAYWLGGDWLALHAHAGYTLALLVVFRFIWGFIGPRHARFSSFLRGPATSITSLKQLFSRQPGADAGHSAIASWSVLALLLLVAAQASTGLFISDDIFYAGPYNGVVSNATAGKLAGVHHLNFNVLQAMVLLHLCAVGWYRLGKKTDLVGPMLHGHKQLPIELIDQAIDSSRTGAALIVLTLAALAVTALVQLAPPPPMPDYF